MLNITNGSLFLTVTSGAFNQIYKSMGWSLSSTVEKEGVVIEIPIEEKTEEPIPQSLEIKKTEENSEENEIEELLETPLSEMTIKELKMYAKHKNIDITGLEIKSEILEAVKAGA